MRHIVSVYIVYGDRNDNHVYEVEKDSAEMCKRKVIKCSLPLIGVSYFLWL